MAQPSEVHALELVLTARCNLKCTYCYQDDKNAKRMSWETLQASLELLLASECDPLEVTFYGGEPLLELPLIRRAVAWVEAHRGDKGVRYTISTNGLLLTDEGVEFLAAHDFYTQLSFDGVPEAQALRGAGTFAKLDGLLDRLRVEHTRFFRDNLHINITLTPRTIDHVADSVEYFLGKGVRKIDVTPAFTHVDAWQPEMYDRLDAQYDRILDASLDHYRRTGLVPFGTFRKTSEAPADMTGRTMCGITRGETLAVDVDGQVNGCVTLLESYQTYSAPFLRDRARAMNMGDLRDPRFAERLEAFPRTTRRQGLFHAKQNKHSTYGRCRDCRYLSRCSVCPTSIGHIPGNTDPDRVPDFNCALQQIALAHQDRFPVQPRTSDRLTGQAPMPALLEELLRFTDGRRREEA